MTRLESWRSLQLVNSRLSTASRSKIVDGPLISLIAKLWAQSGCSLNHAAGHTEAVRIKWISHEDITETRLGGKCPRWHHIWWTKRNWDLTDIITRRCYSSKTK